MCPGEREQRSRGAEEQRRAEGKGRRIFHFLFSIFHCLLKRIIQWLMANIKMPNKK
jgi:hypothetical protein